MNSFCFDGDSVKDDTSATTDDPDASGSETDGNVARSASVISGLTFLSRILGLVREALFASLFELSMVADAFVFAYQIPNLFRKLFGEGSLSAAFIPVYTDYLEHRTPEERNRFGSVILSILTLFLGAIVLAGVGFSYLIPDLFHQGATPSTWLQLFARLFRILFPYMMIICLVAVLGGLLNAHKHFAAPAAAPVLMNVVLVSTLCWLHYSYRQGNASPSHLIFFLAGGVLVGGLTQFFLQIPPLATRGFRFRFEFQWDHPGLHRLLKLLGPSVVGLAVVQVNLVFDSVIAKSLVPEDGAIAALWYGNRVMQVPFALIGIAVSTAAFPHFSSHAAREQYDRLAEQVRKGLQLVLFLAIPSSVGLVLLAQPSVRLLYQYGSFDPAQTTRTAAVLLYYSTGIWAFCVYHVMTRAFYALEDTKTPAYVAMGMVVLNVVLNVGLVILMGYSETGIALSTSLTSVANIIVLIGIYKSRHGRFQLPPLIETFIRCSLVAGVMGLGVFLTLQSFPLAEQASFIQRIGARILQLSAAVGVGAVLYLGLMYLLRTPESNLLMDQITRGDAPPSR